MWRCVKEEKGTIIVLFAFLIVFMIGLVGLSADTGNVYHQRSMMQNAADAAALAGAYKLPSTTSASTAATQYAGLNGITGSDTLTITYPSNEIKISITRQVKTFFAQIIGVNSFTVSVHAVAKSIHGGNAFDYALFHGDTKTALDINGGTEVIQGDGHSNCNTIVHGSALTVTGTMESAGTFSGTGPKINIGTIEEHANVIDMPDFSSLIAGHAGHSYSSNATFNGSMDVSGNIYANGSITFNGGKISGLGTAMATGDITVTNDNSYNNATSDGVCLYSQNGNITINGGKSGNVIYGIIYAPNGSVTFNGTKFTLYGAIIAKDIRMNGVKVSIYYDSHAVTGVPVSGVQLVE